MGAYLCLREYRLAAKLKDLNNAEFIDSNLRPISKPSPLSMRQSTEAVEQDFRRLQENAAEIVKSNPIRYRMNTLTYQPFVVSPSASPTPGPRATYKRVTLPLVQQPLALLPPQKRHTEQKQNKKQEEKEKEKEKEKPSTINFPVAYPSMSVSPKSRLIISATPSPEGEVELKTSVLNDDHDDVEYYIVYGLTGMLAVLVLMVCCTFYFKKPAPTRTNYINRDPRPVLPTIRRQAVSPGTAAGHRGWVEDDDVRDQGQRQRQQGQGQQQQQQQQWSWQAQEHQIMRDRQLEIQRQQQERQAQHQRDQQRLAYYYTHRND